MPLSCSLGLKRSWAQRRNIIYEKLDLIAGTGANVVLSRLAIGDLATQYFAVRPGSTRKPYPDVPRILLNRSAHSAGPERCVRGGRLAGGLPRPAGSAG